MEIHRQLHQHRSCNPVCPGRASISPVLINSVPWQSPTHSTTKATDDDFLGPSPHMFQRTHPQTSPLQENKRQELLKVSSCPEELAPSKHRLLLSRHQPSDLSVPSFPNTAGPSLAAEKLILKTSPSSHPEACSPRSCCQE